MTHCLEKRLQEYAAVGIPGAWITDDESVQPTISKFGGSPKYFYLWQKTKEIIDCLSCKQKMYLLTQINAPLMSELSQRNIYVFMCCNPKCTKSDKGWKVIVQRGPTFDKDDYLNNYGNNYNNNNQNEASHDIYKIINKHNKNKNKNQNKNDKESFWNHDLNHNEKVIDESHEKMDNKITTKMDELNDDFSRLMAMQQKLLNDMDTKGTENKNKGSKKHKNKNKNKSSSKQQQTNEQKPSLKKGCFIPFEIAFNDEEYYKNKNKTDKSNKIIKWNNKEIDLKKFLNDDDNESNASIVDNNKDPKITESDDEEKEDLFSNYLERIGLNRTQCIRYSYGDAPLVPYHCNTAQTPTCIHCGHQKVFEFQIMSTALMYLEPKQIHHEWLTILVFVCPKTCQQSNEEFVMVCNEA